MKGNLFLNSDDQKFNFGPFFFGPPGTFHSTELIIRDVSGSDTVAKPWKQLEKNC